MEHIDETTNSSLDEYLRVIERKENIDIVAAWVMGSHARNVNDATSDIDIKVVYTQPIRNYISFTNYISSIDYSNNTVETSVPDDSRLDTEVEISGWDAKRFLELIGSRDDGNNPAAFESILSPLPLRYPEEMQNLLHYVKGRFNIIEMYNHYRGLTKRNWLKYMEDETDPTIKRMLYIARGMLYARYIRDTHTLPPIDLIEFAENAPDTIFTGISREEMRGLIDKKKAGLGDEAINKTQFKPAITAFLTEELDHTSHIRTDYIDTSELDKLMMRTFN